MILVCHTTFGHHKPGDEVEVPDGAIYDTFYFHEAGQGPPPPPEDPPAADDGAQESE